MVYVAVCTPLHETALYAWYRDGRGFAATGVYALLEREATLCSALVATQRRGFAAVRAAVRASDADLEACVPLLRSMVRAPLQ